MEILWYGAGCFKIMSKDLTIITDPAAEEVNKLPKMPAQLVTVSHGHPSHSNLALVSGEPQILDGPGEYEIKGATVSGVTSFHDAEGGTKLGKNTIYCITIDEIALCHLGDLGAKLSNEQLEAIGDTDILIVPIGESTLSAKLASEVLSQLEPKIVIPCHFDDKPENLDAFLKEIGTPSPRREVRLKIQKRDLPMEDLEVIVLEKSQA